MSAAQELWAAPAQIRDADDRSTPAGLFRQLHERFAFTVDAAASPLNAKLPRYWTIASNGLAQSWAGERVWVNPPYSYPRIAHWIRKAWDERDAALVVMLVPANRTDQDWWHELVEPFRDRPDGFLRTEFLPGRVRFASPGQRSDPGRPMFGCCLLIWDGPHSSLPADDGQDSLFGLEAS